MRLAIVIGAMALGGCTANAELQQSREVRAQQDLSEALAGRVAGKAQNCIGATSTEGPQIISERTILYREGRRIWRNELENECTGLDQDDLLVIEVHGSQICRNDMFRAVDRGSAIPGRFCRFGSFTPYTKPKG